MMRRHKFNFRGNRNTNFVIFHENLYFYLNTKSPFSSHHCKASSDFFFEETTYLGVQNPSKTRQRNICCVVVVLEGKKFSHFI